jgi:hypothetical protein
VRSKRAHLDTTTDGARAVPVRSTPKTVEPLRLAQISHPAWPLRTGTVRAPVVVSRCARSKLGAD